MRHLDLLELKMVLISDLSDSLFEEANHFDLGRATKVQFFC